MWEGATVKDNNSHENKSGPIQVVCTQLLNELS